MFFVKHYHCSQYKKSKRKWKKSEKDYRGSPIRVETEVQRQTGQGDLQAWKQATEVRTFPSPSAGGKTRWESEACREAE